MKASDLIVEFLIGKGISDVFGYPGGMVTHLMDSLNKYSGKIRSHLTYHEQGAAFAACGYAQASGKTGVAYATSGPGATNLITGICNAFFDSVPILFLTGQVNTYESKDGFEVRQRGFQETDIISMVAKVTKYAVKVKRSDDLLYHLERAYYEANSGRKGPVLIDIPMDISRSEINPDAVNHFIPKCVQVNAKEQLRDIPNLIETSQRPVFLLGNGIKIARCEKEFGAIMEQFGLPVITSMLAVDVAAGYSRNYGFLGAYGSRTANFIAAKCDLLISIGARLDVRQVGGNRAGFSPEAKLIRIDIDRAELKYRVKEDEISICTDLKELIEILCEYLHNNYNPIRFLSWLETCENIHERLNGIDEMLPNKFVKEIGNYLPDDAVITTDVGQNQVWVAQSLPLKKGQRLLFSGGHGAMGYSLPAAIGAFYGANGSKKPIFCFNGDGGFQMNIQELMVIAREKLPIKMIIFNNHALGMIRHFQEMYFSENYTQTITGNGYAAPDFGAIAVAYGIEYFMVRDINEIADLLIWEDQKPVLLEVCLPQETYVYPKVEFGKPNQDQEPLLDRTLYHELMHLGSKQHRRKKTNILNGGGGKN